MAVGDTKKREKKRTGGRRNIHIGVSMAVDGTGFFGVRYLAILFFMR